MVDFTDNDDDIFTGKEHTPIREDAFDKSPQEKIEKLLSFLERLWKH